MNARAERVAGTAASEDGAGAIRATGRVARRVEAGGQSPAAQELPGWLRILAAIIAPSSLITALAFYFGYSRTAAVASYFGIDPSVLGFSTQDYVLRSPDVFFIPLGALLASALVGLWVHGWVLDWLVPRRTFLRAATAALIAVGGAAFVLGAVGASVGLPFDTPFLLVPLSPGIGVGLLHYGAAVRRRGRSGGARVPSQAAIRTTLVCLVMALSLFWSASEYAGALGRGRAEDLAAGLLTQPSTTLYSQQRLGIDAPGVVETRVGDADAAYRWRYRGLRLLIESGGNYFLLPSLWSRRRGVVIVVPDTHAVRVDFSEGE